MVRIGVAQEQALAVVRESKEHYDQQVRELEAEYKYRQTLLRAPVVEAVEAAIGEGVPNRQVALKGLGYADVASLKQWRREAFASLSTSRDALPVAPAVPEPVAKREVTVGEYDSYRGEFEGVDSEGESFWVSVMPTKEGTPGHAYMDNSFRGVSDEDTEEGKRIIRERHPEIVWHD